MQTGGGPICDYGSGGHGNCGCLQDRDCPLGETCQAGAFLGICTATLAHCSAGSCPGYFCDWDSGTCVNNLTMSTMPSCITDYDCAALGAIGSLCDNGTCIACRSSADCVANGSAAAGASTCCLSGNPACGAASFANNTCEDVCSDDQDCVGNSYGPSCVVGDAGIAAHCGCGSDLDCAGHPYGTYCDKSPDYGLGYCYCQTNSDCAQGSACAIFGGAAYGFCSSYCYAGDAGYDYACPADYFCDPAYTCRPRCDDGDTCQGKRPGLRHRQSGRAERPDH